MNYILSKISPNKGNAYSPQIERQNHQNVDRKLPQCSPKRETRSNTQQTTKSRLDPALALEERLGLNKIKEETASVIEKHLREKTTSITGLVTDPTQLVCEDIITALKDKIKASNVDHGECIVDGVTKEMGGMEHRMTEQLGRMEDKRDVYYDLLKIACNVKIPFWKDKSNRYKKQINYTTSFTKNTKSSINKTASSSDKTTSFAMLSRGSRMSFSKLPLSHNASS
eukprot:scaffold13410_cov56-Cyclotella_meneghiniana.AAC.1